MHIEQETTQEPRTSSYVAIVLILSLLIHMLLVLFLLFYQHYDKSIDQKLQQLLELIEAKTQKNEPLTKEEEKQLEKYRQWVAGNARSGGAQVIFKDEPEDEMQDIADEHQDVPKNKQEPQTQKLSAEKAEVHSKNKEAKKVESQEEMLQLNMPPSLTTIFEDRPEKQHDSKGDKQQSDTNTIDLQESQQIQEMAQQQEASVQPKKKITMADIAQGFMNHLHNQSEHHVTVIGNNHGRVTAEQLKYERYIQKIFKCVQTSEKIYHQRMNFTAQMNVYADIDLVLDRNGKMLQLNLVRSTGYSELDEFILFVYKDASSSFPPVPQYIKEDPFAINIRQFVNQTRY
jgi:hypothetical protein